MSVNNSYYASSNQVSLLNVLLFGYQSLAAKTAYMLFGRQTVFQLYINRISSAVFIKLFLD